MTDEHRPPTASAPPRTEAPETTPAQRLARGVSEALGDNAIVGPHRQALTALLSDYDDGPRTETPASVFPRRCRVQQWTAGERAIQDAVDIVERMGADVRLTDAVILLGKARDRVADFVDGVAPDSTVYPPTPGGSR